MITISIVYDHRQRTKDGEEGPVEIRVTANRKPYYIPTGVRVRKERLVAGTIYDIDGTYNADILNERLATMVKIAEVEVNKCLAERRSIDVNDIRRKIWNGGGVDDQDVPTLIVWIKETAQKANISVNTKKRYATLCNKLAGYGKMVRWEQLTVENIYGWDCWLRSNTVPLSENQKAAGMVADNISNTAVYNYHKCLKAMLNRALTFGKIQTNPYDRIKHVFKRSIKDTIDYLTEEQMRKLMELTPVPGSQVALARDLFIFQMFTGLSYSDTQIFDISQYKKIDGKWVNIGQRVKTGVPYVSQLLPPVVELLERYDWQVPKINNQRYNQMLKAIGMCIGIENLHSHMGRHTFATYMLSNGAKIENVSRMLGHTNITQTQRYAKVLAENVREDFDKIEKKLTKTKRK